METISPISTVGSEPASPGLIVNLWRRLPRWFKFAVTRARWRRADTTISIRRDARVDWHSRLSHGVSVESGTEVIDSSLGRHTYVRENALIAHSTVGAFCSVAAGVKVGGTVHPSRDWVSQSPLFYSPVPAHTFVDRTLFDSKPRTMVGSDVWLGFNSVVLPGVKIGHGVIVAAGAVVTRDVADYQIVGGVPARVLKARFSPEDIDFLLQTHWWDWPDERLREAAPFFSHPDRLRAYLAEHPTA